MELKDEVLKYCSQLGLENVGFIKCRVFEELRQFYELRKTNNIQNEFEENDIEKRINPNYYMNEGKTIISIAFPYLAEEIYNDNGFSVYTRGMDYHRVVKQYLDKICDFIISKGGKAISFVDSNALPERYIAFLAGVGFIGKNNMIITKEFGSYIFLGEIITDIEIYNSDKGTFEEIGEYKQCGECNICLSECPTKAINNFRRNCNICLSYLTQKKELDNWQVKALNGRIFGCDSCQNQCHFNEYAKKSNIKEFQPLDFMKNNICDEIIEMGNAEFKNTLKITSCGWRGKNVLKRNAIIRKGLHNKEDVYYIKSDSDYLKKYIDIVENLKKL